MGHWRFNVSSPGENPRYGVFRSLRQIGAPPDDSTAFLNRDDCTWSEFQVSDGLLDIPDRNYTLQSQNLLRLNQPDTEGAANAKWYLGLNRVVENGSGVPSGRDGSGVRRVLVRIE
jgi:hypothetical protein